MLGISFQTTGLNLNGSNIEQVKLIILVFMSKSWFTISSNNDVKIKHAKKNNNGIVIYSITSLS